ncbi:hypothetical protein [Thiomonas sp. FB-6]|uniref:hypothetical protein n=1 Tax=Thiomonas sp. FB-6 TaxID=1158291 RepID=UPI00037A958E|nr:hypothetical protein [Thiomonas sp. FB-6]
MNTLILLVALQAWGRLTLRSLLAGLLVFVLLGLTLTFAPARWPMLRFVGPAVMALMAVAQVLIFQRWVFHKPFRSPEGAVELCVERDGGPEPHPLAAGIGWALWWGMTWRSLVLMAVVMLPLAVALFGLDLEPAEDGWLDRTLSSVGVVLSMLGLAWLLRWPYGATRFSVRRCTGVALPATSTPG